MVEVIVLSIFLLNITLVLGILYILYKKSWLVRQELMFIKDKIIKSKLKNEKNLRPRKNRARGRHLVGAVKSSIGRVPSATLIKEWGSVVDMREPRDVVTFGICLASERSSINWGVTCELLSGTLKSILNQTNSNFRVIICGHEKPAIPEIEDNRIAFMSLNSPPPISSSKFRSDKTNKRFNIGRALRDAGGGYYMQLDADDRISSQLVERVLASNGNGMILAAGYALDWQSRHIAPVPGVWPFGLNKVCGSTSVVFFRPDDLPGPDDGTRNSTLLWNMTRQHEHVDVALFESDRQLDVLGAPAVVYIVNHQQNLSFRMQKADVRGENIVASIKRLAITNKSNLRHIEDEFCFDHDFLSQATKLKIVAGE